MRAALPGLGLNVRRCSFARRACAGISVASETAVAAVAYGWSPYLFSYLARLSVILGPWAAMPWLILFAARAVRSGGWRHPAWFALCVALVGSSNATSLLLVLIGPALWVIVELINREVARRAVLTAAARRDLYGAKASPSTDVVADRMLANQEPCIKAAHHDRTQPGHRAIIIGRQFEAIAGRGGRLGDRRQTISTDVDHDVVEFASDHAREIHRAQHRPRWVRLPTVAHVLHVADATLTLHSSHHCSQLAPD